MKSWKTTISGAVLFAGGIYLLVVGKSVEGGICMTAGVGLLSAKDYNATGKGGTV